MIIAVTGPSGHIGGNLIRALLAKHAAEGAPSAHTVRALVFEDTRSLDGLPIERVKADVGDEKSLRDAFAGADLVYHLAGRISVLPGDEAQVRKVNVDGTRNVVAACLKSGIKRLVHFSSIHAIDPEPFDGTVVESRGQNDHEFTLAYDRSKAHGENEVHAGIKQGLDAVIVNPTGVMGPNDYKPGLCGQILVDLYYRRLPALVRAGFNFVDVRDVVDGAIAAAEKGRKGERYILGGHYVRTDELAALAAEVTGVRPPRFVAPMWLARVGAPFATAYAQVRSRPPLFTSSSLQVLRHHQVISGDKAKTELGYTSRPLKDTVKDAYESFRKLGIVA